MTALLPIPTLATPPLAITVLGAGSWGLTLAWLLSGQHHVTVWDRKPERLLQLRAQPQLSHPVKMTLPAAVHLQPDLGLAVREADIVLLVVTGKGTRVVCEQLAAHGLTTNTILVSASKGIEPASLLRMSDVIHAVLPQNPVAVLSGPTLAQELLNGCPTACVVASTHEALCLQLQQVLSCDHRFRLYANTDVVGVELGGAMKNVFAIASGYMAEKGLGDNARSALITRGLSEMTRLAVAMGADEPTLYGLSGLGDLLATCNSPLSRNYQVGKRLAQGETLEVILANLNAVAEGVATTEAICLLAERMCIDLPITQSIASALQGGFSDDLLIKQLMGRRLKTEYPV
jgi:glycerol-3-phosphate dehydrogenase (NAD(P)+)